MGIYIASAPVNPAQVVDAIGVDACIVRANDADGTWEVEVPDTTDQQVEAAVSSIVYDASVGATDPDDALRAAIESATDFASLKAALLGTKPGQAARVAGRPKNGT